MFSSSLARRWVTPPTERIHFHRYNCIILNPINIHKTVQKSSSFLHFAPILYRPVHLHLFLLARIFVVDDASRNLKPFAEWKEQRKKRKRNIARWTKNRVGRRRKPEEKKSQKAAIFIGIKIKFLLSTDSSIFRYSTLCKKREKKEKKNIFCFQEIERNEKYINSCQRLYRFFFISICWLLSIVLAGVARVTMNRAINKKNRCSLLCFIV